MCLKKLFCHSMHARAEKYESLLLNDKIRLKDVPKSVRLDPYFAARVHTVAFRVDRAVSIERFEEDLRLVEFERFCAERTNNVGLLQVLDSVLKCAKRSYSYLSERNR